MQAAVFYGPGDVRVEERDNPSPGDGEVLLRVTSAGICGGDLAEFRKPFSIPMDRPHAASGHVGPVVLGHEFAGEVVAVGARVSDDLVGRTVACGAGVSCGECTYCNEGRTNLCVKYFTHGFHRDGGLAEFVAVPASICVDVAPYDVDPRRAALAQPMAIAVHAIRRSRAQAGDQVLVIGVGGVGAFLTYAAAQLGMRVSVLDLQQERLEIAERLGASNVLDVRSENLAEELTALSRQDVIYEVSGSQQGLQTALEVASKGSRITTVGIQKQPVPMDLGRLSMTELEFIGPVAHVCSVDIPEALRILGTRAEGWADVAPDPIPLSEVVTRGLAPMAAGTSSAIKTLIDPQAV